MMFDPRNGAADRQRKLIVLGAFALWLVTASIVITVIGHFVIKYW